MTHDPKDLLNWFKCGKCDNVQEHPSFLRSLPACDKCGSLAMKSIAPPKRR